jgi:hypothetical protein
LCGVERWETVKPTSLATSSNRDNGPELVVWEDAVTERSKPNESNLRMRSTIPTGATVATLQ